MLRKAVELFEREKTGAVRLIGFGLCDIIGSPDGKPPDLFPDPADAARKSRERLSETLDRLREGGAAIFPSSPST
jgi:hypothetical protein